MPENKTKPTTSSASAFIEAIADERKRDDCREMAAIMERISGEPATMWGSSIVGFGEVNYRYASGHSGTTMAIGFSPRANAITCYLMGGFDDLGPELERLGPHKTGKGCLYLKRLADIDRDALESLLTTAFTTARKLDARAQGE